MEAGVEDFIPAVKTCFMTSIYDKKYFLCAKVAFARCWGVARSLCYKFPFNFISYVLVLEGPNIVTKLSPTFICISDVSFVYSVSLFEGGAT